MKENIGKRLKNSHGITLVALVVTIIVLLILAGVALSSVLSQDGIFHRAEQATDKYGEAKARETLELALDEAQMQKYDEGLTDEQLTEKINTIGEELPKEKPEHPELQNVIVDGHIFEIDRSVPKIVDYIGPADGVIITAQITQNGDWQNPVATVKGAITKYGGGTVTSSTATATNGVTIPSNFPTAGGSYTIPNITTDTDITITASADDGKPAVTKVIKVRLVRDTTPPTLSNAKAEAERMKIKISANAIDNESGLSTINYTVEPNTVTLSLTGEAGETGRLTSGQVLELTASEEREYTVTFTATDNAGNTTTPGVTAKAITIDAISVTDLKREINASNFKEYIGTKVNYKPDDTKAWRVFYYDMGDTDHPEGFFGDGIGTIYLIRDSDTKIYLGAYTGHNASDNGELMKKLNPDWAASANGSLMDLASEHIVSWLCDSDIWNSKYKTADAKYVVGAPSIEMFVRAYNAYYPTSNLKCGIMSSYGYGAGIGNGTLTENLTANLQTGPGNVFSSVDYTWLASPSGYQYFVSNWHVCTVYRTGLFYGDSTNKGSIRPIVALL